MKRMVPADAHTRARLRALAEQPLPLDVWRARVTAPLSEAENAEIAELVRWFKRRYPTPGERLAYVRRAYRRWVGATGG